MCPRGRFIQRNLKICYGFVMDRRIKMCNPMLQGHFTGDEEFLNSDLNYWEQWVATRMKQTKKVVDYIDYFIAPSKFLMDKFTQDFNVPINKISYLDYGFDLNRLKNRNRVQEKGLFSVI